MVGQQLACRDVPDQDVRIYNKGILVHGLSFYATGVFGPSMDVPSPGKYMPIQAKDVPILKVPRPTSPPRRDLLTADILERRPKMGSMPQYSSVYRVNERTVAKFGSFVRREEADTLRLMANHGIPVPQVLHDYVEPTTKHYCIEMQYVDGNPLDEVLDSLSAKELDDIASELRDIVDRLRSIKHIYIGAVTTGRVHDRFFCPSKLNGPTNGPYTSETAFVEGLCMSLRARDGGAGLWTELVIAMLGCLIPHPHQSVFTHGNLCPQNVLIKDGHVAAILGWSEAGFYPEHWEFVKSCLWDIDSSFFSAGILYTIFSQQYPLELALLLHAKDIIW